jgi:glucokinase
MGLKMFIGLDIGGTYLKGAAITAEGEVKQRLHEPIAKLHADDLLSQLEAAVRSLDGPDRNAVGVGVPGIVDSQSRVRVSPNIPSLNGIPVGSELGRRLGRRVFLENDANAAALAEAWLGAGRGANSVLLLTLGTGIGGGVVLGGRIWTGVSGYAGEIGHIHVDPDGVRCGCGSWGCLETIAGAPGWQRRAEDALKVRESLLRGQHLEPKVIVEAARQGDAVALDVVDGAARALGTGIAAALLLLNVDRVVIAGGVAAAGDFLLDRIVGETRQRVFGNVFADCTFRLAELGADTGVIGAARVAMVQGSPSP